MLRLDRVFFTRPTPEVARAILGKTLVHEIDGQRIAGRVVEAEAYGGWHDLGSHGHRGITPRTRVMFGLTGVSYVYFIYGNYWMFNVVAKPAEVDYSGAVLIRALEPLEGEPIMAANRRQRARREWTNGPAKLALALGIGKSMNQRDLTDSDSPLFFEEGPTISDEQIRTGPRIGLESVAEPWRSIPWRFWIDGNEFVSL
jgi:DNA-3-methyladenine glycosylase